MDKTYTCYSCDLEHPDVECHGMLYCPNPLCPSAGGAWFRARLKSYREEKDGRHSVDYKEWQREAKKYLKENPISALPAVQN